jgi:hypothetical protein
VIDAASLPALAAAVPSAEEPEVTAGASHASIESLIDLEQQVEFFVVLGQDDSAVELLSEFLKNQGADAPLVHQRLLETYHRKGDVAGFERAAARMRKLFGGEAPGWAPQWSAGRDMDAYPEVMAGLQPLLGNPTLALPALENLMFHATGQPVLDLAAYRQALDLYAQVRDARDRPAPLVAAASLGAAATTPSAAALEFEPMALPVALPVESEPQAPAPSSTDAVDNSLQWISCELDNISGQTAAEPPPHDSSPPSWEDSTAAAAHAASLFEAEPTELPRIDLGATLAASAPAAKNELMIDLDLSEPKPVKRGGTMLELKLSDA